jgi:hypothetical protein
MFGLGRSIALSLCLADIHHSTWFYSSMYVGYRSHECGSVMGGAVEFTWLGSVSQLTYKIALMADFS